MSLSQIILHRSTEELSQALKQVKDLNYLDEYGYTPLVESIIIDSIDKATLLVEAGADVNQKDTTQRSALHWAVSNDNLAITELLIKAGADVNGYNISSEPVLVRPLLRNDKAFKELLIENGASITFAMDYINVKLLSHRYELVGSVDIVAPDGVFTEVDYEGFYYESSLDLIRSSIIEFRSHYMAKYLNQWFDGMDAIEAALNSAGKLLQFDNYLLDYQSKLQDIIRCFKVDPIVIPISQEGHAFSIVKCGSLLAVVDRVRDSEHAGNIPICYMNRAGRFNAQKFLPMLYERQSIEAMKDWLQEEFMLQKIAEVPMPPQVIGNCSWANTEAIVPVLYIMMHLSGAESGDALEKVVVDGLDLFHRWREWDRQRALQFFMKEFPTASPARGASISALLAGVVFQACSADDEEDLHQAKQMIGLIKSGKYDAIFESYIKFYVHDRSTAAGKNLQRLLEIYDRDEL